MRVSEVPGSRAGEWRRLAGRMLLVALVPVLGAVACAGEEKAPPGEDPAKEQREQRLVGEPEPTTTVAPEPSEPVDEVEGENVQ